MLGRIHQDELPDYWELSPDARVQAYKDQQKSDRRKVTSWFLPIVACLPAIAFMTSKPVNDGVSLVANALGMMGTAASWVTPNTPAPTEQTAAIDDPKVMAFLDTIAWAEGTGDSYDIAFGFNKVDISGGHPNKVFCGGGSLCSAAAGRYQEMPDTWNATASLLGIKDFSPQSQDKVVIQQLKDLGAYDQIKSGDVAGVFCKLGHVWASFPCNSYGQGQKQSSQLEQIYQEKLVARSGQKTADAVQPTIAVTGLKDWQVSLPQNTDNQTALVAIGLSKVLGLKVGSGDNAATPAATATGKTVFPIAGETWQTAAKTSGFGERKHPITGKTAMHWGQDLPAAKGTPVLATEAGTVLDVKLSDSGCGNEIELQFADGTGDRFCHLSVVHVEKGQSVNAGDAIGEVGSTGDSTGDHLHFEHVVNGSSVDPTERLESLGNDAPTQPAAATPQGNLKWQFTFDPSVPEADKQAINEAAARLSAIVTTDKTIAVSVRTESHPGEWIAKGKPAAESLDDAGLPTAGDIVLNLAYPAKTEPVEHELLHVMGFGTIPNWKNAIDPATHTYKADTLAGAKYGGAIPLSDDGSHWSEDVLKAELMTPNAESDGVDMPLEAVTIAALKDLGWHVSGGQ